MKKKKRDAIIIVLFLVMLVGYCWLSYEPPEEVTEITPGPTKMALTDQLGITIDA